MRLSGEKPSKRILDLRGQPVSNPYLKTDKGGHTVNRQDKRDRRPTRPGSVTAIAAAKAMHKQYYGQSAKKPIRKK